MTRAPTFAHVLYVWALAHLAFTAALVAGWWTYEAYRPLPAVYGDDWEAP